MSNPFVETIKDAVFMEITSMPADWHTGHWFSGPGWYFADESSELIGPYDSMEESQAAMYRYAQLLN